MSNIKKILIVGDKLTGKSSIVQTFKEYEPLGQVQNDSVTDSTQNTTNAAMQFNKVIQNSSGCLLAGSN
jgi:GTPase SAR1 family protein